MIADKLDRRVDESMPCDGICAHILAAVITTITLPYIRNTKISI